jgi:hypothetical protein
MGIPNMIEKNGKNYVFKRQIGDLLLYQNFKAGYLECFSLFDLGLTKAKNKEYYTKWEK